MRTRDDKRVHARFAKRDHTISELQEDNANFQEDVVARTSDLENAWAEIAAFKARGLTADNQGG